MIFDIGYIRVGWLDLLDITLVATLLFLAYKLIRGTVAFNILIGLIFIYVVATVVRQFDLDLFSSISEEFISAGIIASLIVFQQELRRFLIKLGESSVALNRQLTIANLLNLNLLSTNDKQNMSYLTIPDACASMSKTKTGALIVMERTSNLSKYADNGTPVNADINAKVLEAIFYKNAPLHDGAVVISNGRVVAAGCVLPVSESTELPSSLGLRHRSALGISEVTDALTVTVSEETGKISVTRDGKIVNGITPVELKDIINREFVERQTVDLTSLQAARATA